MKRDIFSELVEGFEALADERQGKVILRTHKVKLAKLAPITAEEVVGIRQQLNLSRSVFAMYLRTNTRTLENWEQGRAKPNAQATTLIRLVERFPETVEQLNSWQC
jgi:putative transcriptional regulator